MTTFDTVYCLADKQKSGGCVAVMAKSGWSCGFGRANRARKSPGFSGKIGEGSGRRDSNPRPPAWKAGTLPTELLPHRNRILPGFPQLGPRSLAGVLAAEGGLHEDLAELCAGHPVLLKCLIE